MAAESQTFSIPDIAIRRAWLECRNPSRLSIARHESAGMKTHQPGGHRNIQRLERTSHWNRNPIVEQAANALGKAERFASQDIDSAVGRIRGKERAFRAGIEADT